VLQPHQNAAATVPQSGITVGEMFAALGVGMAALALFRRRRSRTLPRGPDS
jgi:MYXO-CTERM domain-containing protein